MLRVRPFLQYPSATACAGVNESVCPVQQQYRLGQLFAKHSHDLLYVRAGETLGIASADTGSQNDYLGSMSDKQLRPGQYSFAGTAAARDKTGYFHRTGFSKGTPPVRGNHKICTAGAQVLGLLATDNACFHSPALLSGKHATLPVIQFDSFAGVR
jgi:hypothetical protein